MTPEGNSDGPNDIAAKRQELVRRRLRGAASRPGATSELARPRGAGAPLSAAQERLWFLDRLVPESPVCNVTTRHWLHGPLDADLLGASLTEIVRRHEVLRTTFHDEGGTPIQRLMGPAPMRIAPVAVVGEDAERRAWELVDEEARSPFDLARGPLLRARLARLGAEEHLLALTIHHIASDGWSAGLLASELSELYTAGVEGRAAALPELRAQYADYARRERGWLRSEEPERHLAYWRRQLEGGVDALDFPWDRPRPPHPSYRGGRVQRRLAAGLQERLDALGRTRGATLFATLLAGFACLLHRHTMQTRIAVGTPVARRDRSEFADLIGMFLNTLVLQTDLGGDPSFVDLLSRTRRTVLAAYEHQELPFERLVQQLAPARDLSRNPLFQAMFLLRRGPAATLRLAGLEVISEDVFNGTSKFDLTLAMETSPMGLVASLEYAADLLERATAELLLDRLERLLHGLARWPDAPVGDVELASPDGPRLSAGPDAAPPAGLLHELFEAQARHAPGSIALGGAGGELTYAELNARANQLARALRGAGVGPERVVAALLPRSPGLVVAMLAVLKAGGAFLVLDAEQPDRRLADLLDEAGPSVLVTERRFLDRALPLPERVICLDEKWPSIALMPVTDLEGRAGPHNLAYVTYTSGSTGRPKGVMTLHAGAVNALAFAVGAHGLGQADIVLQLAAPAFDASVRDTLGPLTAGARVVIGPVASEPEDVLCAIERHRVTCVLSLVPSVLKLLLARTEDAPRCPSLRLLLVSGEPLGWSEVEQALELLGDRGLRVVNLFGPTECTMTCAEYAIRGIEAGGGGVPVGRPIANASFYVLDERLRPVPAGAAGELYIAGAGLARGYLRDPGRTAERFLPDPFDGGAGLRMYRTGDRVRWLPGGDLRYLGRRDRQTKIRGVRVEPGEAEAALRQHPEVLDATVTVVTGPSGEPGLAAYVVGRTARIEPSRIRSFLAARLPSQLVPSFFVSLDALPRTGNRKVDRSRLPHPGSIHAGPAPHAAPRDQLELVMAQIWEEVLDRRPIGIFDDFFTVGGHSLHAVILTDRVHRRLAVDLPIAAVFQAPTIALLCDGIRAVRWPRLPGCLVQLQAGTADQAPLFLVHPQSGDVVSYVHLVRALGGDLDVYGLQAVGLYTDEPPLTSMRTMVQRYLVEIRRIQPQGPYWLAGWSFGGHVAFEMAVSLESAGDRVGFLGLLDTRAPSPGSRPAGSGIATFAKAHGVEGLPAAGLSREEKVVALLRRAAAQGRVPESWDVDAMRRLVRMFERHGDISDRFAPAARVRADIHLFRAGVRAASLPSPDVDEDAWRRLTEGRLHVTRLPASHYDLVAPPHATALATALRRALAESPGAQSGHGAR
jgi:amino acid adenylation domain-containing protein